MNKNFVLIVFMLTALLVGCASNGVTALPQEISITTIEYPVFSDNVKATPQVLVLVLPGEGVRLDRVSKEAFNKQKQHLLNHRAERDKEEYCKGKRYTLYYVAYHITDTKPPFAFTAGKHQFIFLGSVVLAKENKAITQ